MGIVLALCACAGRPVAQLGDETTSMLDGGSDTNSTISHDHSGAVVDPVSQLSWVTLTPATFLMGSPKDEPCRLTNETRHPVQLTHPFKLSATEVTQKAFSALMGYNPSHFKGCGECPVDSVDWNAAVVFCNRLSEKHHLKKCYSCVGEAGKYSFPFQCTPQSEYSGKLGGKSIYDCPGFRLPTEAEWEYAYRAGTSSAFYVGPIASCHTDTNAESIAWYGNNAGDQTHEVAGRLPNNWGLYDMSGNLWEWVQDWYDSDLGADAAVDPMGPLHGKGKVVRGGGWSVSPGSLRAASRNQNLPGKGLSFVGFRCARSLP